MRTSQLFLPTLREDPADAEAVSHRLMLRAGLVRQVAAGIYNWLPLGQRVLHRIETVVREEMNAAGAQEVSLPMVQPAELWEQSGRWQAYGPELLRLQDRHQRSFCLGPTHEEVITTLIKHELRSYRQLPINLYQIQTKFRDERRPRFGVMRGREFIMKDAYSFDLDEAGMTRSYERMVSAYERIFTRLGLAFCRVAADSGSIGGETSHEFHILAESGEDQVVLAERGDYAASLDLAEAPAPDTKMPPPGEELRLVDTPGLTTIAGLVERFELPITRTIKTLIVAAREKTKANPHGLVALLVRGDHQLNTLKAERLDQVAKPLAMADEADIRAAIGAGPGSLGPIDMPLPIVADHSVAVTSDFSAGANQEGKHYFGINWGRDVPLPPCADLRNLTEDDPAPDGGHLRIARAIEIGHVFQLGRKYSEPLGATVLNEAGETVPLAMGCYGIGITRLVAATIEQHHDDKGIIWPPEAAPFQVALLPVGLPRNEEVREAAEKLYGELAEAGFEILFEDRDERPGVLFADQELIGIPHLLVLGARDLAKGVLEYRPRGGETETVALDGVVEKIKQAVGGS